MEKYYLLSLKHTSPKDPVFTMWRGNAQGYTFSKLHFGIYGQFEAAQLAEPGQMEPTTVMVKKSLVDSLVCPIMYEGKTAQALPLNDYVFEQLGIKPEQLQRKHPSIQGVEFVVNTQY